MTLMTTTTAEGAGSRRNVLILAICQALSMSGSSLVMTISALAGQMLATDKTLATLPLASQFIGTMCATIPASYLMARYGRRVGFTFGQCIGVAGASLACWAILSGNFWAFVAGSCTLGVHNAFWQYYRFAAADTAPADFRERAISYVMAGGVIAAFLGPQIAKWTYDLFTPVQYAGGYVGIITMSMLTMVLLQAVKTPKTEFKGFAGGGRPLAEIVRQPTFILAVATAMFGYGVMTLVMTATPLAMTGCGFAFTHTATVIQWHVLAMFGPSFFTGDLIRRFGVVNVIIAGAVLNTGAMAANLSGIDIANFTGGLVLLGLGWNFLFIGGTTLVTETYRPEEKAKVQAINDFLLWTTVSVASLSSGAIHAHFGWTAVNMVLAVPMFAIFLGAVWFRISGPGNPSRA